VELTSIRDHSFHLDSPGQWKDHDSVLYTRCIAVVETGHYVVKIFWINTVKLFYRDENTIFINVVLITRLLSAVDAQAALLCKLKSLFLVCRMTGAVKLIS
jgi:hypothetical protein